MDTPDRPDRTLPSPLFHTAPATPVKAQAASWEDGFEPAAPPTARTLTLKVALRAARRHWWQILGLWIVATGSWHLW